MGVGDPREQKGGRTGGPQPLALVVLTRDPTGRMTGRKSVLATAADSLERSGLRVAVVVLSRHPVPPVWHGRPVHRVPLPPLGRVALTAAGVVLGRRGTLNEALFDSRRVRRSIALLAARLRADVVVADGLRTTGPAMACGLPVVVHLDDLLSDRYANVAAGPDGSGTDVLGFFATQLPRALRGPAGAVARRLVGLEAGRADRRERELAGSVAAVALTSQDEADELSRRAGRPIAALPMAVALRDPGRPDLADPCSFVFLGLLDYAPNRAALRWWVSEVAPALRALGGGDVVLTVVGQQTAAAPELEGPGIRFTGYLEDLGAELRRHRGMVAPVLSGAGVKTKVLDGWSVGLPVVATPAGAAGCSSGAGLLVAEGAPAFAAAVVRLRDDASLAAHTGRAGREVLEREWSPAAVGDRWAATVLPLLPGPPPAPSSPAAPTTA